MYNAALCIPRNVSDVDGAVTVIKSVSSTSARCCALTSSQPSVRTQVRACSVRSAGHCEPDSTVLRHVVLLLRSAEGGPEATERGSLRLQASVLMSKWFVDHGQSLDACDFNGFAMIRN